MTGIITQRVELCKAGNNPTLITEMPSGYAVLNDHQPDPITGGCILLPAPSSPLQMISTTMTEPGSCST